MAAGGSASEMAGNSEQGIDSITKAEYVATSEAAKEAIWLCKFLRNLEVVPVLMEFQLLISLNPSMYLKLLASFSLLNGVKNIEGTSKTFLEVQVAKLKNRIFLACSTNISLKNCHYNSLVAVPPLQQRVFHFSREIIVKLKAKAIAEAGINRISSPQALAAYLCVRTRLQPQLPQEYVGNIVQRGRDNESESGKGKGATWNLTTNPLTEYGTGSNASAISNSPRFDVYGNDFGWGKPIAVTGGSASKRNGKATTSARVEKASADIEIRLSVETLQRLQNDAQFMDAASVIT
ncbi:protein ENHANCED PSEUDOMONAS SUSCEPTIBILITY 1-like [Citrus sinensis]|uniref:protein ENHANCED PSEUDOMONAS SUSCEPTIBILITY 1-like n=1 Tax=Citrus sinensis TaxID=2711 RepID=UPI00227791A0|nr:protein ENHANCED PSEUDOMONAS SUSCEPTIBILITY 1-like [Citrus sinensis]